MCGLTGIFDTREQRPIPRGALLRMNESQSHRGPDEGGVHIEPGVGLAHRRLSIIDVSAGQQPLASADGSLVVVFNGEIYNHRELARALSAKGHVFATHCDTEVILHAWREWGESCVDRFRGMFAFALWDRARGLLFLARDRLGVKPLFYAALPDGRVIFGSELKSLLAHGGVSSTIDPLAIEDYFALGYVPDPRCIFAGVQKLPPAHTLTLTRGQSVPAPKAYWDVRFAPDFTLRADAAGVELADRLAECVSLRMESEVPLGAFLSGGVDSSAVVAAMSAISGTPVTTCSIAFAEAAFDESRFAEQVARQFATHHVSERVGCHDVSLIDTLARTFDEPFADSSALPTYRVCQMARRFLTVVLSGDGADESFGGYRRYRMHLAEERWRRWLPAPLRAGVFGALGTYYPKADRAPRWLRAKTTFQALARDAVSAYFHSVSLLLDPARAALFSPALTAQLGGYRAVEVFRQHAANAHTDDALSLVQYLDLKTYLPGDINTKVDRTSMAHGLEVREPLMDHTLVEWLATLPPQFKVSGGTGKWLLKKTLEPVLGQDLLYRPKMGFAVPMAAWLRGPVQHTLREAVLGERLFDTGWFNRRYVTTLVEDHLAGRADHSAPLWSLMMFEAFLRNVADQRATGLAVAA